MDLFDISISIICIGRRFLRHQRATTTRTAKTHAATTKTFSYDTPRTGISIDQSAASADGVWRLKFHFICFVSSSKSATRGALSSEIRPGKRNARGGGGHSGNAGIPSSGWFRQGGRWNFLAGPDAGVIVNIVIDRGRGISGGRWAPSRQEGCGWGPPLRAWLVSVGEGFEGLVKVGPPNSSATPFSYLRGVYTW